MLARSAIRAEHDFSRCPEAGKVTVPETGCRSGLRQITALEWSTVSWRFRHPRSRDPFRAVSRGTASYVGIKREEDVAVLQINGLSLYVEDHGSGRPVLLLHGWPDSAYLWRHQIPFLVKNGFRAIAPDLRGFGRSDRPELESNAVR
jgi:hypothetical protein